MEKIIATELEPNGLDAEVLEHIEKIQLDDSILYYGFPVFKDYEEQTVKSKIVVLSKNHGLILLSTCTEANIFEADDNLSQVYNFIEAALKKSKLLRKNKKTLALELESYLVCLDSVDADEFENDVVNSYKSIDLVFGELQLETPLDDFQFDEVRSIIEGAKALSRPSKRTRTDEDPASKLNILIALENEISNFDIEQRKIAISLINGPQRIRGLAGSGKTVVLAMKAAHIHLQHPHKKILFTFYTKSLYGLIVDLLDRFYRHFAGTEPNWDVIDVHHSWGGKNLEGVTYNASFENGVGAMTFSTARSINFDDPFREVCKHLLPHKIEAKYDYILIDEAQDLPNEFFQICYKLCKGSTAKNKNIVWGYDELQSIFNVYQRTPEELFGHDEKGKPLIDLVALKNELTGGQSNDLVLYKCYRNPLEILVTAHALGFGLYSDYPVQMLENKEHWEDVGYRVEDKYTLDVGSTTSIIRDRENSPLSIYRHQTASDLIRCFKAKDLSEECQWVSDKIQQSIEAGLKPQDIMVICFDDYNAKNYFAKLSKYLTNIGVRSNNVLTSTSYAPPFKIDDMVTLTTVHRAKGNEAAEVFAIGLDALHRYRNTRSGRNKIFTAFTRTKAWLNVTGIGEKVDGFFQEIRTSLGNENRLIFKVPDVEKIKRDLDARPKELVKIQEMWSDLREQGMSDQEIKDQLELWSTKNI
ncbi:DEAD/DEAH box helicase [Catenovulum agarivorans]|uniref:DEAD/DEAH box helicase n=1 Tax=Catenovulum agarivorans TaxID=1172192 RepID=UPI00030FA6BE|nr:ATP-binding domain-containing protein [Catenovulum agarivorans]